jgi:hypothetical protein
MQWVTRARPKTDRIACPWLIRRFIDPDAEIVYVPADEVIATATASGGRSFDAPGADYHHQPAPDGNGEWCSFETLIDAFDLTGDPALVELARAVHAADVTGALGTHPLGAGLLATGIGGLDAEPDDHRLLEKASFIYDALYAYCEQTIAAAPAK